MVSLLPLEWEDICDEFVETFLEYRARIERESVDQGYFVSGKF